MLLGRSIFLLNSAIKSYVSVGADLATRSTDAPFSKRLVAIFISVCFVFSAVYSSTTLHMMDAPSLVFLKKSTRLQVFGNLGF